ncbi:hypothetical protein Tco_1120603, partial [Tanacetum coccineum]
NPHIKDFHMLRGGGPCLGLYAANFWLRSDNGGLFSSQIRLGYAVHRTWRHRLDYQVMLMYSGCLDHLATWVFTILVLFYIHIGFLPLVCARAATRCAIPLEIMEILEFKSSSRLLQRVMGSSGNVDLAGDEDPTNEDGDTGMGDSTGFSVSVGGEISSGGKKYGEICTVKVGVLFKEHF